MLRIIICKFLWTARYLQKQQNILPSNICICMSTVLYFHEENDLAILIRLINGLTPFFIYKRPHC